MSDFLGQLVKGFFRSAVNQVGRDTGRIISGKIYGGRGSSSSRSIWIGRTIWKAKEPVYVVGPPPLSTDVMDKDGKLVSFGADGMIPHEWVYKNMTPVIYESSFTHNLSKLFWLCLLPGYAELYLIVAWLKIVLQKTAFYKGTRNVPVYIRDRTISVGYRQTGYADEDIFVSVPAQRHQMALIIKGSISLLLAVILGIFHYKAIIWIVHYLK